MMLFPFMRRTLRRSIGLGAAIVPTTNGCFNFDKWHETADLRLRFELLVSVAFFTPDSNPQTEIELAFVNPTPAPDAIDPTTGLNTDRMVLLFDNSGTLTNFVENNQGPWWPVPWREKPDLPYELQVTAPSGDSSASVRTIIVELVWVPRWPCLGLNEYLARLAGVDPRGSDVPIDPTTGQPQR